MGLRSPQELNQVNLNQEGSVRFQGAVAPKIDTSFLKTLSSGVEAQEAARLKAEKERQDIAEKEFENVAEELRQGAQGTLALTEGIPSTEESRKQRDWLSQKMGEKIDKAPEKYKQNLNLRAQGILNKYNTFALPYVAGQVKKVKTDIDKTYLANQINNGIENSGNLDYLATNGKALVEEAAIQTASRLYGDNPEMLQFSAKAATSEMYRRSVEMQANSGFIDRAQAIHYRFANDMSPEDQVASLKIINSVKTKMGTKEASGLADLALQQTAGNLQLAEAFIKQHGTNDKQINQALSFVKINHDFMTKQRTENDLKTISKLNQQVSSGKPPSVDEINQIQDEDKRAKYIKRMEANRWRQPVATNNVIYNQVADELINMSPEQARNFDLRAFDHEISAERMSTLEGMRNEKMKAQSKLRDEAQQSTIKDAVYIISNYAAQNNISKAENPDQYAKLYDVAMTEWERLKQNKNMTQKELRARLYTAMKQRGMQGSREESYGLFGLFSEEVPGVSDKLAPDLDKVPEGYRIKFRKQFLEKYKRPATMQEEEQQMERLISAGVIKLPKPESEE